MKRGGEEVSREEKRIKKRFIDLRGGERGGQRGKRRKGGV